MINITALRELVRKQAEDEILWSIPIDKLPTFAEEYLRKHLRFLHAIIEGDDFFNEEIDRYLDDNQSK